MQKTFPRSSLKALVGIVGVFALVLVSATAASAHVGTQITDTSPDGSTVVLTFDHGCSGEPTIAMAVQFPDTTADLRPEDPDGWSSEVDANVVTWSGGSVPDETQFEFTVVATFAEPAGTTVHLPVIQSCANEELAWIQIPEGDESLDYPAPSVVIGEMGGTVPDQHDPEDRAEPDADAADADDPTTTRADENGGADVDETDGEEATPDLLTAEDAADPGTGAGGGGTTGLVILLIVVAIIAVGAVTLYLRNRKAPPAS